jgi:hypothetical protein
VLGSIEYKWDTEFIMLSVRALDEYVYSARAQYGKVVRLEWSWAHWKEQNEAFPRVPPSGQRSKWKALKPRFKAQRSQESIWESGWEVRNGAGNRVMECEKCTENDKDGSGWERQWQ